MGHRGQPKGDWPWAVHQLDAVIFDLDGTLVDTAGDFVAALQRMLTDLPAPFPDYVVQAQVVERLIGRGSEDLIESLLRLVEQAQPATRSIADEVFPLALQRYQQHYVAVNGRHARVYPGVVEGLRALRAQGWPLACVTNKPTAWAEALLRAMGLDGYIAFTLGGDALAHKKPHPLPLWMACERLGTAPARTLMVGDSSNDAQAARAAGCPVVLMTYGYNHGQPIRNVEADAFADSLVDGPWQTGASARETGNRV